MERRPSGLVAAPVRLLPAVSGSLGMSLPGAALARRFRLVTGTVAADGGSG